MSPLLFREMRVHNPDLADLIGLHEAILVQQIHYKCVTSKRAEGEEFCWWVVTMDAIAREIHMSSQSARRIVKGLEDQSLIIARQVGSNRTQHYRVNYRTLYRMCPPDLESDEGIAYFEASISTLASDQNERLKRPGWAVEEIKMNASRARDPYPDSKSTEKTHIHGATSAPSVKPQRAPKQTPPEIEPHWSEFVAAYPPRDGNLCRSEGQRIFARLAAKGEDLAAVVKGARGYRRHCDDKGSTGGPYVKQMPSFLNGRIWEEYEQAPQAPAAASNPTRKPWEKNIEGQLAKDREVAIRNARKFGISLAEFDPRFADE